MLPLDKTCKKIAVIGPNADDIRAQYGDWTYFSHPHPKPDCKPVRPYVIIKESVEAFCKEKKNLDLSGRQMELFYRLKVIGKPICTVLVSSKPLCLGDAAEQADAVLCSFNGGMEEIHLRYISMSPTQENGRVRKPSRFMCMM